MVDHESGALDEPIQTAEKAAEVVPSVDGNTAAAAEAVVATAAAADPLTTEGGPINGDAAAATGAMSKNQMKKLKKREAFEERKRHKKEQKKLQKQEEREIKKSKFNDAMKAMTEEEHAAWRASRAERVAARHQEKNERKARMTQALESGQRIIIDLEFPDLMTEGEQRSMAHQVAYCYGTNTRTSIPAHLILSGVKGTMSDHLGQAFPGFENWIVTSTEKTYLEHFSESKQDLVYLTADSPNELQELDPGKIYIVGGIVDRNRHKNLCYNKAVEQGIATARLPFGENIKLATSMVMCTNHVVDIMLKWMELKDWEAALNAVIPTRKRKDRDEEEEGKGVVGGKEQKVGGEKDTTAVVEEGDAK